MESTENPYEGPENTDQSPPGVPGTPPSSLPKVFGIIHIVYAAIGGLSALIGLGGGAFTGTILGPLRKEAEESGKNIDPVLEAFDSVMTISIIQSVVSLALAILLLVSGIHLLKYRSQGRKLSNIWAIARIVTAIPMALLAIGAQTQLQEEIQKLSGASAMQNMSVLMGAGGVIGIILVSLYPVISLIFVNQDQARKCLK